MDLSTSITQGLTPRILICLGAVMGPTAHLLFFIRGEWHVHAPTLFCSHFTGFALIILFFPQAFYLFSSYCISLFGSIVLYRLVFHRLTRAGFDGPKLARVSKLWHVWHSRDSRNHLFLHNLHSQYGDFIRTGPSEITVFDPKVYAAIDGPHSTCMKSDFYDMLHPSVALVTVREKEAHGVRRREWNRAFSAKALSYHEEKIMKYIEQLDSCIERDAQQHAASDLKDLLYWFGFDAMGDFVLSTPFNMLQKQEWHYILQKGRNAMSLLGFLGATPWLFQIALRLAPRVWVIKDWCEMVEWAQDQMKARLEKDEEKLESLDVAHWLLKGVKADLIKSGSWAWLAGDSLLAIVGGSEPTASALIGLFRQLCLHPEHTDRIREEVRHLDIRDPRALAAHADHLNACINEALRLYPALPSGGNRTTTEMGMAIGDRFIPPHTTIVAPRYTISRREDCFERGQEFVPERWTTRPELIRNKAAFVPFGTGSHTCIGRHLSADTMRLVVTRIVTKYRFSIIPGGDRVEVDLKDQFAAKPGSLRVMFERIDESGKEKL